jgi:hypothetical protein
MKKIKIENRKNLRSNDEAVVGIIVTVLLIGLFLAVMVMLNTVYVPQWLEESEASHMEDISNQFAQLKYALDIQSIVNDSTAVSTSITLGIKELPFFDTGRTFDTLEIVDDGVEVVFTGTFGIETYTSDIIQYTSSNSYFVDQSYIYEAGALIISQDDGSVLFGKPSIIVKNYAENISFVFINVQGINGKTEISGYGKYPIYTECVVPTNDYDLLEGIENITIKTNHPHAWEIAMQNSFRYSGMNYTITKDANHVYVSFTYETIPNYNIYLKEVDINSQIAFGLAD